MAEQPEISASEAEAEIKKRFFPDVADEEWRQRGGLGAIFTKLCKDAGFLTRNNVLKLPQELQAPGDEENIYGQIIEALAAGEVRKKGTYTTKRPRTDDRRTGGTAPVHHFPADLFNNLMDTLKEALANRGKEPALPLVPREKTKRHPQRARTRYPDKDGKLKEAFCRGLGIDPSDTAQDFVDLFRGLSHHIGAFDVAYGMWSNLYHGKTFGALTACMVEELPLEEPHGHDFAKRGSNMAYTIRSVLVDRHVSGAKEMTKEIAEACGKVIAVIAEVTKGTNIIAEYIRDHGRDERAPEAKERG